MRWTSSASPSWLTWTVRRPATRTGPTPLVVIGAVSRAGDRVGPLALVVLGPVQVRVDHRGAGRPATACRVVVVDRTVVDRLRDRPGSDERDPEQVQPVPPDRGDQVVALDLGGHRHPRRPHAVRVASGRSTGAGAPKVRPITCRVVRAGLGLLLDVDRPDVQPRQRLQPAQVAEERVLGQVVGDVALTGRALQLGTGGSCRRGTPAPASSPATGRSSGWPPTPGSASSTASARR